MYSTCMIVTNMVWKMFEDSEIHFLEGKSSVSYTHESLMMLLVFGRFTLVD